MTTGKIPILGFKAAAIKFVTLFGFSPNASVAPSEPAPIPMTGSSTVLAMTGSGQGSLTGSGIAGLTGSTGD